MFGTRTNSHHRTSGHHSSTLNLMNQLIQWNCQPSTILLISETKIVDNTTWELFHEVKAFLIAMSFFAFLYISERYHYRVRDEVVNEQFLIEEIYEREIHLAAEYERERREELRLMFGHLASVSRQQCYGTINEDQDYLH